MAARAGEKPVMSHSRKVRFAKTYPEDAAFLGWLESEEPEEVLEPELPIIDAHHHLWDHRGGGGGLEDQWKQSVYKLPEILEDMYDGHNIVKTVFAQAVAFHHGRDVIPNWPNHMRPLGEVEYCQGVAALCDSGTYGSCRVCAGIVGTANLRAEGVEELLLAQMRYRNFKGIRTGLPDNAGPLSENAEFLKGFALLEKYDLSYDWYHSDFRQIPDLCKLAQKFPKVRVIMDHLGGAIGPHITAAELEQWKKDVKEIAEKCPNVVVKFGGVQMAINKFGFDKRAKPIGSKELCEIMLPYYGHVLDCFGPKRCMGESNFPPDKDSISSRVFWNLLKRICAAKGLSAEDKKWLFHDCAAKTYKLDDDFMARL